MKPLKRWQKNNGKKKMAQPQKCVVKPFLASLRGFEPRTFRLGERFIHFSLMQFGLSRRSKSA